MNHIRLFSFIISLFLSAPTSANGRIDIDDKMTKPDTVDEKSQPQEMQAEEEQLRMEKDEPLPDSFGQDKYNENVDPEELEPEK